MNVFYTPDIDDNKTYVLNESESKHAIRVLRLNVNDKILLVDGKGNFIDAVIINDNPKKCEIEIISSNREVNPKPLLHVAIAPTKNNDRIEWFVEKCTEIGINEITPILCKHSERKKIKQERLVKTAVSAMKQSLKATLPYINDLINYEDFIQKSFNGKKYIAHCNKDNQLHLNSVYKKGENSLILIGPEGDFSKEEIKLALENGFEPITFGKNRLRTETAGIVACSIFNMINE